MENYYKKQLAYIHDKYYGDIARNAAEEILKRIGTKNFQKVIDLGCGSGILAAILSNYKMNVIGVDVSIELLKIAKEKSPTSKFIHASLFDFSFENADIICAIGEPFNYLFDSKASYIELSKICNNIYKNLTDSGLFIFDILTDEVERSNNIKIIEQEDFTMFLNIEIDEARNILERKMIFFTRYNQEYKKDSETHQQFLFNTTAIENTLREVGFSFEKLNGYHNLTFRKGHISFVCKK